MSSDKSSVPHFRRICLLILDSLGIGEMNDASDYGDTGAHTLLHTFDLAKGLHLPELEKLGLLDLIGRSSSSNTISSYYGRMKERSPGKDTATGHWEMMGVILQTAFPTFLQGFPPELINAWSAKTGSSYLGNKAASGTAVIDELGAEHLSTLKPIVYTSADSVFQIAAHEKYYGLQKLYDLCQATRDFFNDASIPLGRVIARPFLGEVGSFKRTGSRRDYALNPYHDTALDLCLAHGVSTVGIGKIPSIFNYRGISKKYEAHNDDEALTATLTALKNETQPGVIFTNLNDLDMIYGHRRDAAGYGRQLETIDRRLSEILAALTTDDLLLISADHGNDPTYRGTDHTREFVPLLAFSPRFSAAPRNSRRLKDRDTFADLGQTICENFSLPRIQHGTSLLSEWEAA